MIDLIRRAIQRAQRIVSDGPDEDRVALGKDLQVLANAFAAGLPDGSAREVCYLAALIAHDGDLGGARLLLAAAAQGASGTSAAELENMAAILASHAGDHRAALDHLVLALGFASTSQARTIAVNLATASWRVGRPADAARWAQTARTLSSARSNPHTDAALAAVEYVVGDGRSAELRRDTALTAIDASPGGTERYVIFADLIADCLSEPSGSVSEDEIASALSTVSQRLGASLGQTHPAAAIADANRAHAAFRAALASRSLSRCRAAIRLMEGAGANLLAIQGAGGPDAIVSLANLATARFEVARATGASSDAAAAKADLARLYESSARALGTEHRHTLTIRGNLQVADRATDGRQVATDDSHQDVLDEVYIYLDHECTDERQALIEEHLDECSSCLREYEVEQEVKELVARACGSEQAPAELRERVLRRIAELAADPADLGTGSL